MKAGKVDVAVTATFSLTGREIQLLHHMLSYDNDAWVNGMQSSHYQGGVTKEEMRGLLGSMKALTGHIISGINQTALDADKNFLSP